MLENKFIGLFGGAFDPVHKAHIEIAENVHKFLNLNKIIFIPTGISCNGIQLPTLISFLDPFSILSPALIF